MRWLLLSRFFLFVRDPARAEPTVRVHDDSFTPDRVLRVARKEIGVGGIKRYTTLVNNTLPGPELHIPEEEVVWIRVYNDMTDANLTMVSDAKQMGYIINGLTLIISSSSPKSTGMASPRRQLRSPTALRWRASGLFHRSTTSTTS